MSCYHPLKAVKIFNKESLIDPSVPEYIYKVLKGKYDPDEECKWPDGQYIPLPCGRCIGCRLDYSRQWADRCMLEAQYHKSNIFLTLTYDDSHLPECLTGSPVHPLVKRDLQLFMKRLRKKFPDQKIRFFAAGEYSPAPKCRPHYHLIIFGLKLDDIVIHKRDPKNGFIYYISDSISQLWPYGFHLISDVSWDTCAYTARYIMKKQKGKGADVYEKYNFPPEFTLMSRKPGIGYKFYEDHNDIVVKPYYIPTRDGSRLIRSNRYFDKCFDIDYPSDLEFIKQDRIDAANKNEYLKSNLTSLSYQERKRSDEINKEAAIKSLKRKEVF